MPGLPPFAKYQNGIDQCLFQLVFTMVVVAKMTVTDAGGEESGRGAHLVERVVMGWWRGVEERTLWRDQNFDLKNLFGGIRYEENGNVLVGDSCVHCPGWWSSSIGIKSNNDCMLPKSWKWYLFSDAEWFYCCSIFDTRSGLMKIFDTSFGSIKDFGRDVRVRAGLGKYSPWMPRTKFPSPAHKKAPGWSHTIFLSQNVSSKASCWADLHLDLHWFQFAIRSLTFKITPNRHGGGLGDISERWILTVRNISISF